MEKKFVGGRGTTYCPKCQNVKPSIAITGKIAVGKSQVTSAFKKLDCYVASADQLVHDLYVNAKFIKELQKKFPEVFNQGKLDKSLVIKSMTESKSFRRKYETFIWSKIKDLVNDFLIHHTDKVAVVEVPLLFDAKMEDQFTYLVGVESSNQVKHLISRNDLDYERRLKMNERNSYDLHRKELDFIIDNEGSLVQLEEKVKRIYMNVIF
jgi:dephospho-CoA kinase